MIASKNKLLDNKPLNHAFHPDYLHYVLLKHGKRDDICIHITDAKAIILVSTDVGRKGKKSRTAEHIMEIKKSTTINNRSYGTPIFIEQELYGSVIVHGSPDIARWYGELIRTSVESALEYAAYSQTVETGTSSIARMLLENEPDTEKLLTLMNRQEIDPELMRTVICISLQFHATGQLSHNEQIRTEVIKRLNENRYLNSQDIVYQFDEQTIAVIKSFMPPVDFSRVFPELDEICLEIEKALEEFNTFMFGIAYGNLYRGTDTLRKSFDEALEIIRIGQQKKPNERRFTVEDVFYEKVLQNIDPLFVSKTIEPVIAKLGKKDKTIPEELISSAEAFVDNCMSISKTTKNQQIHRNTISIRLKRLKALTGLDPAQNFLDAFVVKMLAAYIRQRSGYNNFTFSLLRKQQKTTEGQDLQTKAETP